MRLAAYAVVLAAVIVLLWPGTPAGRAVVSVTGAVSNMFRA
jgi:hypothetical protein